MALFSSSSKSQTERTPLHKDIVNAWGHGFHGLSQTPMEMFPSQMYAAMDPRQTEALGMQEAYARGLGGMVDPTMAAWRSTLSAPDVADNPYVQGMLEQQQNLLGRNLAENIMPGIASGAIGAGQLGSSRQGVAEGIAARGTQEALASQAAQTQMAAYLAGLGQQQFGLGAAPGMAQFGMAPAQTLAGVGDVYRTEEQRAIDEAMQRHQFEQEEPWRRYERFGSSYFPAVSGYGETTVKSKETPSALGVAGQLAGLGLAGAGMYQGFGLGGGMPASPVGAQMSPVAPTMSDPFAYMNAYSNFRRGF